jgi:hypothetical protein
MIYTPTLFLLVLILLTIVNVALLIHWTNRLVKMHGSKYSFKELWRHLNRPIWYFLQRPPTVDAETWKDVCKFRDYNRLFSFIFFAVLLTTLFGAFALNRKGVRLDLPGFLLTEQVRDDAGAKRAAE